MRVIRTSLLVIILVLLSVPQARADSQRVMLLDRLGGWVGQAVPLSDGSVLAGSDDRLLRFSPDLSRVTAEITPGQGTVMAIHVLDSEILVLTERGLLRLDDRGVVQAFAPGGGESFAVRDDLVAVAAREAGLRLFARQPDGTLIPLPGVLQEKDVLDVAILDGQLFAAAGQGGLYRVDSSQQPATLARVTSVQGADAVTVSGRLLVVGSGPRVFVVDPERDALIGIYTPLGDARRMVVRTDTVLVADQRDGLKIMWLPTPDRPVQAYTENSSPAYDVALSGNTAVVAGEDNLRLLDIGSLFQPLLLGRVGLPGRPEGVAFDGETAAAALGDDGVALIDATNYATPSLIRRIPLEGPARSVLLDEGWLYAAAGEAGLAAINLAEPEPIYVQLGCPAADLAQRGSVLYIACEEAGLVAVDVLRRAAPAIVGSLAPEAGNAYRTVSIQGKRAYLASDRGVVVADINRPAQMGRLALVREAVNDVGAADTYLYGLHAAGLTTYDIRATAEPGVLNRYRSAEGIADMAAQGNTLLLTNSGPGADIIALSLVTPAAPYELGNLGDTGFGTHITTGERFAWVGLGHGGFQQIELTEGVPLPRTAYMTLPNPGRITTEGQTVIAAGVNGWSVLTMAGPAGLRPQTTVRRDLPIQDIDADGNRIVLAAGEAGLWVYNRAGQLAGRTALTGPVTRVAAVGDLIYAADTSGLAILDARSLTLLNRVTTPVPPMDLLHQGEQVVLLLVDGSLVAIDVSQPAAGLVSLSQIETRRPAQLIPAPYDSSVYTLSENGMLRLNVDDPAQITVFDRGELLQVASRGFFTEDLFGAYLPGGPVTLYDVRDLDGGVLEVGGFRSTGQAVLIAGSAAFVAYGDEGFGLVDIRQPDTRRDLLGEAVFGLHRDGDRLFTVGESVTVWDISDPMNPVQVDQSSLSELGQHVTTGPAGILLVSTNGGVELFAPDLTLMGRLSTPSPVTRSAAVGDRGYAALAEGGLLAFTLSEPRPLFTRTSVLGTFVTDVLALGDSHLLVSWEGGIEALGVDASADPPRIVETSSPTENPPTSISGGDPLVLTLGEPGLSLVAAGEPVMTFNTPGEALRAVYDAGTIYVADGHCGLRIIDVSGDDPEERGYWRGDYVSDVALTGDGEVIVVDAGELIALNYLPDADPVLPPVPQFPLPANGSHGHPGSVTLQWSEDADPCARLTYNIYLGIEADPPFSGTVGDTSLVVGELNPSATYHWRVEATDRQGDTISGPVWQFSTAAAEFRNPIPDAPPPFIAQLLRVVGIPLVMLTLLGLGTLWYIRHRRG